MPDVVCCHPEATALEAARLMRQKHVGDVLVVHHPQRKRAPIGAVTACDRAMEVRGRPRGAGGIIMAVIARETHDTRGLTERTPAHGAPRTPVVDVPAMLYAVTIPDDLRRMLPSDMQLLFKAEARAQRLISPRRQVQHETCSRRLLGTIVQRPSVTLGDRAAHR